MDPESLPDYVAPSATEDTVIAEEPEDPDWMKQLQDQLDALEVTVGWCPVTLKQAYFGVVLTHEHYACLLIGCEYVDGVRRMRRRR